LAGFLPRHQCRSRRLATTGPILVTLGWVVVFIAVFAPLSVRKFRAIDR
jgi:hypothetical protein